jgi:hypothetical protein
MNAVVSTKSRRTSVGMRVRELKDLRSQRTGRKGDTARCCATGCIKSCSCVYQRPAARDLQKS